MQRSRETVVVDSSVAVKWYLRDEDMISQADRLFGEMRDGYVTAIAPYLARYEVS